jgi:hypothetical protein
MKDEEIRKPRAVRLFHCIIGLMSALTLTGCVTDTPTSLVHGSPNLLNFLADGKTTQEQVLTRLGQPSGSFESGNILTYRLGYNPQSHGYFLVEREGRNTGWPTWSNASFSLVLVFNNADILQSHSLVKVNQ